LHSQIIANKLNVWAAALSWRSNVQIIRYELNLKTSQIEWWSVLKCSNLYKLWYTNW
jgi:hypothetical protein